MLNEASCLEGAARRLNLIVDACKQGGAPNCASAKYFASANEATALTESTMYDDDDGDEGTQGRGIGKGQGNRG